jgi:hypothetical protein
MMPRFEIELQLTGLKLHIRGERADVPVIASNVGQQIAGLLEPAVNIVDGVRADLQHEQRSLPEGPGNGKPMRRRGRTRRPRLGTGEAPEADGPLQIRHDPERFGTPRQDWNTCRKSIWLLYIVQESLKIKELSSARIANAFNQHFRQSGLIRRGNVGRDLGKAKTDVPSLVGENTNTSPTTWFLTTTGINEAQKLVAEARGGAPARASE